MKNSFFSQFAPQEPKFFAMLKKLSKSLVISSDLLVESVDYDTLEKREAYYKRIKEEITTNKLKTWNVKVTD